jgi:hypothetical protein
VASSTRCDWGQTMAGGTRRSCGALTAMVDGDANEEPPRGGSTLG